MAPTETSAVTRYGSDERGRGLDDRCRRRLQQPRGLALARDGSILVADFGNHCVYRFAPGDRCGSVVAGAEGKMLETVDPLKDIDKPLARPEGDGVWLKRPVDVCVEPGDGHALVLDSEQCSVQRFGLAKEGAGGPFETIVPQPGALPQKSLHVPDAVKNPRCVIATADGSVIVCDTWAHRVLKFAPTSGAQASERPVLLAGSPNSCGAGAEQLAFPSGVALAEGGALLVADTNNHRVQLFPPGELTGTTVAGSAEGSRGSGLGELDMPTGICVDSRGYLFVADRGNSRLLRFPPGSRAGDVGEVVAGPELLSRPWGVCLGAGAGGGAGTVLVSDERQAVVFQLETSTSEVGPGQTAPADGAGSMSGSACGQAAAGGGMDNVLD